MGRILILTNSPLIGRIGSDILTDYGHQVWIVGEIERALQTSEEHRIEVILLDLASPRFPGLEILATLREQVPDVPVIAIAAHPASKPAIDALRAGAYDFISRALLREELINAVERAGERHRMNLENRRLLASLRHRVNELSALNEVGRALCSTLEPSRVLDLLVRKAQDLVGAEAGSLLLLDEQTRELSFVVALGEKGEQVKALRLKVGEGIAGWVVKEGVPLLVPNAREDPRFFAEADRWTHFETRSILCVPIKLKEKVIGAIEVLNKQGGPFHEQDLELLTALSDQAGVAIENARLYQREQEMVRKLQKLSQLKDEFIGAISEELRRFLTHIIGYAELLEAKEVRDERTQEEFIAAIREESHRLWYLVEEFLDFDRLKPPPTAGGE